MKYALIVTHQRGFEADPVIDELRRRGCPVFRLNTDIEQPAAGIAWTAGTSATHQFVLSCDGRRINSQDIAIGWCQQLPPYLGTPSDSREILQRENYATAYFGAWELLEVPWLNRPKDVLYASNKLVQLSCAARNGLKIPKTLVSNLPQDVSSFAKHQIIAKNVATPWVTLGGRTYAAYTKLVNSDWLTKPQDISFCPLIYQEYHERSKDYRVVIVDRNVFCVSCASPEIKTSQHEDVRLYSNIDQIYSVCDLSREIIGRILNTMRDLSINYCSADIIEDKYGDLYFLELNVCGSWWWVDELYDGEIAIAIADFLEGNVI